MVSAAKNRRRKGGRFPTVRHENLSGFIGRSRSPTRAQAEEREEGRRLEWDHGNTNYMSFAKRKPESPRAAGGSFVYNRNSNGPRTEPRSLVSKNPVDLDLV